MLDKHSSLFDSMHRPVMEAETQCSLWDPGSDHTALSPGEEGWSSREGKSAFP